MPSSMPYHFGFVIDAAMAAAPVKTILDVGIGYGKWGFLFHEFLDGHYDRVFPDQWKMEIHGVEIFEPYIKRFPWLKHFYKRIFCADIANLVLTKPRPKGLHEKYDIIYAGDVIEHLEKTPAVKMLRRLVQMSRKTLILSIPLGAAWMGNKIVAGNQWEHHRSTWSREEIEGYAARDMEVKTEVFNFGRGPIGAFAFTRK